MSKWILVLSVVLSHFVSLGDHSHLSLRIKDYEEMRGILNSYIEKSKKSSSESSEEELLDPEASLVHLKTGLRILFLRPDTDNLRASLLIPLKTEINTYKSFLSVLFSLVEDSIFVLKNKKSSVMNQADAIYILENAISYTKSIRKKEADEIFSSIAKAKIKISKKLVGHFRLNLDRGETASPSHISKKILKKRLKARAKKEKQEAILVKKAKAELAKKQAAKLKKEQIEEKKLAKEEARRKAEIKAQAKKRAKEEQKAQVQEEARKKARAKKKLETQSK